VVSPRWPAAAGVVGQVTRVKRGGHGLYQAAEVLPAVDVNRVEEVAVLVASEAPGAQPAAKASVP